MTWRHVKGHSGHKWNDYVDKQADLGRSGARDCGAPEWQDDGESRRRGESSTVSDDMPINGGGTTIPLDDIGDGASSYADMTHPTPPKTSRGAGGDMDFIHAERAGATHRRQ